PHMKNPAQLASSEPAPIEAYVPAASDTSLKFSVLREHMLAPYRLRPDRRLAGVADSTVTARYVGDRWHIACGEQELGTVPELPDFPDMLELSTECAR